MKEIVLSFSDIRKQLVRFGFCGDKGVLTIRFDCTTFFEGKDTTIAKLLLIKPDGTNSAINLTVENGMAVYAVEEGVTDVSGYGTYQLLLEDGTNLMHSPKGMYYVGEVINDPTPPAPAGLTGRTFRLNQSIDTSKSFAVANVVDFNTESPEFRDLFITSGEGQTNAFGALQVYSEYNVVLYVVSDGSLYVIPVYEHGGWQYQGFDTITFVSEPTSGDFNNIHFSTTEETLAWLAENATEVTGTEDEYTPI